MISIEMMKALFDEKKKFQGIVEAYASSRQVMQFSARYTL